MGFVSKYGLVLINIFVVAAGLSVVGISAAILQQETVFGLFVTQVFYTVPLTALLLGVFITFLGLLGCFGAVKENQCMLKTYSVIVGMLLVMVLVIGVSLLVFTMGSWAYVENIMDNVYDQYDGNSSLSHDLDVLQNSIQCCGIHDYEDWVDFKYGNGSNVADGCCRNMTEGCGIGLLLDPDVEDLIYTRGCLAFVTHAFNDICIALGAVTVFMAGMQVLSIAWACLIVKEKNRYRQLYA